MIREDVDLKIRGDRSSLAVISNKVRITVSGRADLNRLAKVFDRDAVEYRKAGKHALAAVTEGHARRCRTTKTFRATMPAAAWAKLKGGM